MKEFVLSLKVKQHNIGFERKSTVNILTYFLSTFRTVN